MSDRTADGDDAAGAFTDAPGLVPEAPEVDGSAGSAPRTARETSGGVFLIGFWLMVVVGCVAWIATQRAGSVDGTALLAESFDVEALPFELEVGGASRLADGQQVVLLERPDAEEPEKNEPVEEADDGEDAGDGEGADTADADDDRAASSAPGSSRGGFRGLGAAEEDEEEEYDWTTLDVAPPGSPPIRAFVVWYPRQTSKQRLERLFRDVSWQDLRDFGADGGRLATEKGTIAWAGFEADYVIERELERGGTFRDWGRINLSLGGRACVLIARWQRGSAGSKETLEELAAALRPHATDEGSG